ncbi:exosortase [Westiellopsis prolifica IICB1]|nr:exosortase [Westiellopsis prolifica IICB1]
MAAIKQFLTATLISFSISLFAVCEARASFTFTKIADTKDGFTALGSYPAINNDGTVVFSANLDSTSSSILIGNGETTSTITDTSGIFSLLGNKPAINDINTIAFDANIDTIGSGIFIVSNEITTTIAESSQPRGAFGVPVINNKAAVAFLSQTDNGHSILINIDGSTTVVVDTNGSYSDFDGYAINDANTIAFSARLDTGERGIFTINSDGVTIPIADTTRKFSFVFPPAINNLGTVAFKGVLKKEDGEGIFLVNNGTITTIADNSKDFSFFENPAINDIGTVAFKGVLKNGGLGIFTGADPAVDKVIVAGDILFGSTVKDIYFSSKGLNNSNQIVFYATLADGTGGIFRANPQSETPNTEVPSN